MQRIKRITRAEFILAIEENNLELVQEYIAQNPHDRDTFNNPIEDRGISPLFHALIFRHDTIALALLSTNLIDVNFRTPLFNDLTALMLACERNFVSVVMHLIKNPETDLEAVTPDGVTAKKLCKDPLLLQVLNSTIMVKKNKSRKREESSFVPPKLIEKVEEEPSLFESLSGRFNVARDYLKAIVSSPEARNSQQQLPPPVVAPAAVIMCEPAEPAPLRQPAPAVAVPPKPPAPVDIKKPKTFSERLAAIKVTDIPEALENIYTNEIINTPIYIPESGHMYDFDYLKADCEKNNKYECPKSRTKFDPIIFTRPRNIPMTAILEDFVSKEEARVAKEKAEASKQSPLQAEVSAVGLFSQAKTSSNDSMVTSISLAP